MKSLPNKATQSTSASIVDIDGDDKDHPLWAVDYVKEMYEYYRSVELPIPNYMQNQTEVTARARATLVGWVIEVHAHSKQEPESLYLIVNIIDRFLGTKNISLDDLQLIGVGALHIGTKYEETDIHTVQELVDLCANAYDEDQVSNPFLHVHICFLFYNQLNYKSLSSSLPSIDS